MFLEQGPMEMAVVAAFALIVVGPKDLPVLLRRVGKVTARVRGMAAEFRASFDELARQSELDELRKEVDALRHGHGLDTAIAPVRGEIARRLDHAAEASGSYGEAYGDEYEPAAAIAATTKAALAARPLAAADSAPREPGRREPGRPEQELSGDADDATLDLFEESASAYRPTPAADREPA